jgi:poly(3-hydroxybutyrate) depolymerase
VHDICTGVPPAHKKHFEAAGAGHYGIFSGRRWRDVVYPTVKAFIKSYQPSGAMPAKVPVKAAVVAKTAASKPVRAKAVGKA